MVVNPLKKYLPLGLVGGGVGMTLLSALLVALGFNDESNYTDTKIGIQFAMQVNPTDAEIFVWMRAPSPLFVKANILNIQKINEDGSMNPGGLVDLFPLGDPTHGAGEILFEIMTADEFDMPDLVNRTQATVPMAWIRKEALFPTPLRVVLMLGSFALDHWNAVFLGIIGFGLALIGGGIGLRLTGGKTPIQDFDKTE